MELYKGPTLPSITPASEVYRTTIIFSVQLQVIIFVYVVR